ncbi:hypothetical protein Tco_1243264 [Tanacetum coccineum]
MANLRYSDKHNMVAFLKKPNESVGFTEIVDFLKGTSLRTLANGTLELVASIENKEYTITEASVRRDHVPLLPALLAGAAEDQGEGLAIPTKPQSTPIDLIPSPSQPQIPPTTKTQGDATTTFGLDARLDSGTFHESPLRSNEAPLPEGNTSGSVEDSMQLKELMAIVPKLVTRIDKLEKELKETKQTLGNAVIALTKKVKALEMALKRKTKKVVLSDLGDEEIEDQGRKIQDLDDDPLVSLVKDSMEEKEADFITPTKVSASGEAQEEEISPTILEAAKTLSKVASQGVRTDKGKRYRRRARSTEKGKDSGTGLDFLEVAKEKLNSAEDDVNTGIIEVNSGSEDFNTGSLGVNTGSRLISTPSVVQTVNVVIPSPVKSQRERKEPMTTEDIQATQKTKAQIKQENTGLAEVMRLQALQDEEEARQYYTEEGWDTIKAKLEANAELTKSLQREDVSSDDFEKRMVEMINLKKKYYAEQKAKARRSKPMTQAQQRDYMSTFIKNKSSSKLVQFMKLTFEELKDEFEKLVKSIERFVPMETEERGKRQGAQLVQESSKKPKIDSVKEVPVMEEIVIEPVIEKEEEIEKPRMKTGKRKKQKARKGNDVPINAVLVDTKPPSIVNWKIIKLGKKGVYQIIRENGNETIYINFGAMLKSISMDNLTELYRLVMQRYGTNEPEEEYEKVFWGDLKTMFDPPLSTDPDRCNIHISVNTKNDPK